LVLLFFFCSIIYRDLKPENIGYDVRGVLKIFDFGLAQELRPKEMFEDGTYELTGFTGTIRYMPPEVAQSQRYNSTVDVYSFSILLWEMLSLKQPFADFTCRMHNQLVVMRNVRPVVPDIWGSRINNLLTNCWSPVLNKRMPFEDICTCLSEETYSCHDDSICDDMGDCNSSTHGNGR